MGSLVLLALLAPVPAAEAPEAKAPARRYLRPAQGKLVLESEVATTAGADGSTYVSRTDRGVEVMTLTLRRDKGGRLRTAEALLEKGGEKKAAVLTLEGERAELRRGEATEALKVAGDPIVTTAPDWTDIFDLVRRYDAKKGGRQEFAGVWIHPVQPTRLLTFTVERTGGDAVRVKDRPVTLDRYEIRLRSGAYVAWADEGRVVWKLIPAGKPAAFVVLEGYEEPTRGLGGP